MQRFSSALIAVGVMITTGCHSRSPSVPRAAVNSYYPLVGIVIDSGNSLQSDQLGAYLDGANFAQVFASYALTLCVGANRCTTLPEQAGTAVDGRRLAFDLNHPITSSGAIPRGIVRPPQANVGAFWGQDTTQRVMYGAIEGWALRRILDLPIGQAIQSERIELRLFVDGKQHILQFGPWVAGQYQRSQGRLNGNGTTPGTILRTSATTWEVHSASQSIGRLWDNSNPSTPIDLGLYAFNFALRFEATREKRK